MDQGRQIDPATAVQPVIERLVDDITRRGISMRLLSNAQAYLRAASSARVWIDPACAQQDGGFKSSRFWIDFADTAQNTLAVGAARLLDMPDIMPVITSGELWYPGGFADHCALKALDAAEPSKLIGGQISYLQLAVSRHADLEQDLISALSKILQALALRHHKSDYVVQLSVNAASVSGTPLLADSYRHEDFLACNYFPPADSRATLTLLHSSAAEFLTMNMPDRMSDGPVKTAVAV